MRWLLRFCLAGLMTASLWHPNAGTALGALPRAHSSAIAALVAPLLAQGPRDPIPETNPFSSEADIQQGQALFQTHCSYCHGSSGEGGRGADLTAGIYRRGGRDPELYASVRFGVPGSEMGPVRATDDEVWKMVAFVKGIGSRGLLEKAPGDPAAGHAVYQKTGCGNCHRIGKEGGALGPELTDIGRRRGLTFLAESLAKPEADIPDQLSRGAGRSEIGTNRFWYPVESR